MNLADRVTVFRAGRVVGHREIGQTSVEDLAALMVGRKVNLKVAIPPEKDARSPCRGTQGTDGSFAARSRAPQEFEYFRSRRRSRRNRGRRGQRTVRTLAGSFFIPRTFSALSAESWLISETVLLTGTRLSVRASGVGMIPEDRLREGLLLEWSLTENYLLGLQNRKPFRTAGGFVDHSVLREKTEAAIREYDVRPAQASTQSRADFRAEISKNSSSRASLKRSPNF